MRRLRDRRARYAAIGAFAVALQVAGAAAAPTLGVRPAPLSSQGFVGVNVDGPLVTPRDRVDLGAQMDLMVRNGVESIRVAFSWAEAQPYAQMADVPAGQTANFVDVDGVPTDFSATDRVVALAAARGLRVLPTVIYAPRWDARPNAHGLATPAKVAPYADYLTALVDRYGPRGTFWTNDRPRLPIRSWQIWNEPNLPFYWPQPSTTGYLKLLGAAHSAVDRADPGAQVVLAAITNFSWQYLAQIYRGGGRNLFDVIAANPFTATPRGVIEILRLVRQTASRFGDATKPLLATEVSWTSARTACECAVYDWDTTNAGQARRVAEALPLLAANRKALRLTGFYYYTWMGDQAKLRYDFNFAGLLGYRHGRTMVKPALATFALAALALEHCASKGRVASSCGRGRTHIGARLAGRRAPRSPAA